MTESVNLRLPEPLLQQARELAVITDQSLHDVLLGWLQFALSEQPLDNLSDNQLVQICRLEMPAPQRAKLNLLLKANRRNAAEEQELAQLRAIYRQSLVRKAKATRLAVERGLLSAEDSLG